MTTKPKTALRAPLAPVSIAPAPPVTRAPSVFNKRDAQLQALANTFRRELEPSLGDQGFGLRDWELDSLCRAIASGSVLAEDKVLRLAALRVHFEEVALGDPDAISDLIAEDGHGLGPVF